MKENDQSKGNEKLNDSGSGTTQSVDEKVYKLDNATVESLHGLNPVILLTDVMKKHRESNELSDQPNESRIVDDQVEECEKCGISFASTKLLQMHHVLVHTLT